MKTIYPIFIFLLISSALKADVIDANKKHRLDSEFAKQRINLIEPEIVLPFTTETKRLIDVYTFSYLPGAKRIIQRTYPYYEQYDHILIKKGLPKSLKNIAIVESNMDPWTFSNRGAVGVWQLMKNTARAKGLIIDKYVDERFDPLMAGNVAFDYLSQLHQEFQDWNLTLIAYNYGPTALRKTIRYCGSDKYEEIKEALPKESQRYASRLAAATYLNRYHKEYLQTDKSDLGELNLTGIKVYEYITFNEIAAITGLSKQTIVKHNPAITFDYLPANDKGYTIHLPLTDMVKLAHFKNWDISRISNFEFHRGNVETMISFCTQFDESQRSNEFPFNPDPLESISELMALRREQILRMLSISIII